MIYHLLGKPTVIDTMQKPTDHCGSVFMFTGNDSLKEIGLNQTFYFKCKHGFSNELPVSHNQTEIEEAKNNYQHILSIFLEKSIWNNRLTGQFEEPWI